jgi:outer membrane biosynthesis protein TonB
MYNVVVQSSERPGLNAEALALGQQWTFTPPICDDLPNAEEIDFTLHFQG